MKCYTSKIELMTKDLSDILANADKKKSIFINGIKAALYNIDDWLTNHREIFCDEKQISLFRRSIANNIDPRNLEIKQEYKDFFQTNMKDQLWEKTTLSIRNILSEIIRDYVGASKSKDGLMSDYIYHLSMGIRGAIIHEESKFKQQQQQSESSWQDQENIENSSTSKTLKPKKSVSWVETVRTIPKTDSKIP
jgi:hypothetical protein